MNDLDDLLSRIKTKDGKSFEIPFDGTLSILALGDVGLLLWREKRRTEIASKQKQNQDEKQKDA